MTSLPIHRWMLAVLATVFIVSLSALSLYLEKPMIIWSGAALLAGAWLITRVEYAFYLLLISIPWSIEYMVPPFATDLPDEPLMLLTSIAAFFYLIANRATISARHMTSAIFYLLVAQFLWSVFTAITSTDQLVSFKFVLAKSWYLAAFVVAPIIIFRDRKAIKYAGLCILISMLALTALVMYRHYKEGFTFSGINPSLDPFFRNHVNYSALLACMFPLLVACYHLTKQKAGRFWITVIILFTIVAIYFSYARGAWLAIIVSLVGWWLLKKRMLLAGYVITMVFVFGSLAWLVHKNNYLRFAHDYQTTIFHENFQEHLVATYQFKDVSTAERFYRWIAGVRMVKDNWQTGFGPNTFPAEYKFYTVPAFRTWVSANEDKSTVHNYFLTITIEQGIPALLLLLLVLGYAFYAVQKVYSRSDDPFIKTVALACAMLLCIQCTVNFLSDLVETDKVGSIFYITLATIIALERHTSTPYASLDAMTRRREGTRG